MMPRAAVALVLAGLLATPAAADVACRKGGRVFARPECRKREKAVEVPVDLPGALPAGPPGDPGPDAPPPVRVVDAAGRQLGLFTEPGHEDLVTVVVFEIGAHLVYVFAGPDHLSSASSLETFYHQVANCSDPGVLIQKPTDFVRAGAVVGTVVYYAGDPIETKTVVAREELSGIGGCGGDPLLTNGYCCRAIPAQAQPVGPMTMAFDTSAFTPPFHLEP